MQEIIFELLFPIEKTIEKTLLTLEAYKRPKKLVLLLYSLAPTSIFIIKVNFPHNPYI
jgi:hypothetical protein